jgi:uncharacterized protein DUF4397
MKTLKNKTTNITRILVLGSIAALVVFLFSCKDKDDDVVPAVPVAYVSLYNASPDAPDLDIVVDNNRINTYPFSYTDYTGYLRFYTGNRNLKFRPYLANNVAIDTSFTLEADNAYSIFVTGRYNDAKAIFLKDNTTAPASGQSKVRIVNLSPDAGAINLVASDQTTGALFSNISFQQASDFKEIAATEYDFTVRLSNGQTTLLNVPDIRFQSGWYYTIVLRGFVNPPSGDTNVLSAQIIVN